MSESINKITDKIELSIGNKNEAGGDINISKRKFVIKSPIINMFNDNDKCNDVVIRLCNELNQKVERLNSNIEKYNLDPDNIKSVAHYEDIEQFVKMGLRSDADIVDFLSTYIKEIVNSSQQSYRNTIIDAEKFILNASDNEIAFLIWGWLYSTFLENLIQRDSNWINTGFENIVNLVRKKYPLKLKFYMSSDLTTFSKVGCNITTLVHNITLTKNFLDNNKINLPNGVTLEYILKKVPEFDTKKPDNENFLVDVSNVASHINKSLNIAAAYFLQKIGVNVKI